MSLLTDRDKTAHLLRRFGLGASEAEIDYYLAGGTYESAVEKLLDFAAVEDVAVPLDKFANDKGQVNMKACQAWWYARILTTRRPLEQALTVFWHNHFATSAEKVDAVGAMHEHVETLREHCMGRFQDLLSAVSKDPAMLYWLDNHENKKGKPNENFAREVMELFTLGIGNYSEKDVQEAARALTGWTYGVTRPNGRVVETPKPAQRPKLATGQTPPPIKFVFRPEQHDDGEKTILGNRGNFDGEDLLGILCGNPRTALFLTEKFLTWFVMAEPPKSTIERVAKVFRDSGMDIKTLCRTAMLSPEFVSDKALRSLVKNPVSYCVSTMRQLGLGERIAVVTQEVTATPPGRGALGLAILAESSTKSMGMDLLYPPDVSGWKYGNDWISSATMVERMKWSDKLFGSFAAGKQNKSAQQRSLNYPAMSLFAADPTPKGAVARLLSVFDAHLPQAKVMQLEKAANDASGGAVSPQNANAVASAVCRLIFGSPEFQLC